MNVPSRLPCGHPPYKEEDKIILDHCFECGWSTPARKEADILNEIAVERGKAETKLIEFARSGKYTSNETMSGLRSAELKEMLDTIAELHEQEEAQRQKVRFTREEEEARGIL